MIFNEQSIRTWAYTTELDEAINKFEEDDESGDMFDHEISCCCSLEMTLEFASDPTCLKRYYFVHKLIDDLCSVYKWPFYQLSPFKTSHLMGINSEEDYLANVTLYAKNLYRHHIILNKMLTIDDPLIQFVRNYIYLFLTSNPYESYHFCHERNQTTKQSIFGQYEIAYYDNLKDLHGAVRKLMA